jgi:hypothetical protein
MLLLPINCTTIKKPATVDATSVATNKGSRAIDSISTDKSHIMKKPSVPANHLIV